MRLCARLGLLQEEANRPVEPGELGAKGAAQAGLLVNLAHRGLLVRFARVHFALR